MAMETHILWRHYKENGCSFLCNVVVKSALFFFYFGQRDIKEKGAKETLEKVKHKLKLEPKDMGGQIL